MSYIISTEYRGIKHYVRILNKPEQELTQEHYCLEGLKNNATIFDDKEDAEVEIPFLNKNRDYTVEKI